jgi:hypothetical protein
MGSWFWIFAVLFWIFAVIATAVYGIYKWFRRRKEREILVNNQDLYETWKCNGKTEDFSLRD